MYRNSLLLSSKKSPYNILKVSEENYIHSVTPHNVLFYTRCEGILQVGTDYTKKIVNLTFV